MRRYALVVSLIPVCAVALWGQSFTGNLTGVVTDPQGALIPGAEVTLTNTATGETRTVVTTNDGRYTFSQLNPSAYNLTVKIPGFKEYNQSAIRVSTNQSLELNVKLEVGNIAETIEVTATQPLLDTRTANQSVTLESRAVQELPVNARNPFVLAHATAGVVAVRTGVSTATQDQNHNRFSMNGGRDETVLVLIDGVPASAGDWSGLIATPGVDAVNEAQIVRNTYEAQFGKTGGGVINLTSKGGSQEFHGTAFEYLRNDNLDANNWFNNRFGRPKSELKRHQAGGTIGGPVWRSKRLYGFFGFEALRQGSPSTRIVTVPTELQRQGDFSRTFNNNGTLAVIYDPLTTRPNPERPGRFIRDPFPGNRIPANRLDPVALNVLKLFPLPNTPGTGPAEINNFVKIGTSVISNDRYDARIDWTRSSRHTVFWRFTKSPQQGIPPELFERDAETAWNDFNPRWHTSLGNTFTLSPTSVVNVLLGGGQWIEKQISKGFGYDHTILGIPAATARQFDVATPFAITVGDYTSVGNNRHLIAARAIGNAQVNVSNEFSAHSVKFGWALEYSALNFIDANSGSFNFDRFFTGGPDPDLRTTPAGNSVASLLLGTGSGGSAPIRVKPASTQAYWALYAQDAWKLSPRLTVNYGLRYEVQPGRTERYDRLNYFDFDAPSPLAQQAGIPNLKGGLRFVDKDNRNVTANSLRDFAPRFGIAYRATDRLVVRAGYGVFYLTTFNRGPLTGTDGFSATTAWDSTLDGGRTPNHYLRDPFPAGLVQPTGSAAGLATSAGLSITSYARSRPTAYMQQYSLDLQYELTQSTMVEVGYVGNQGRRLSFGYNGDVNINQIPDSALALGNALREQVANPFFGVIATGALAAATVERRQLLRPFPQFQNVTIADMPGASSSYNALVAKLNKRFSQGLTVIATYQLSKSIDNASENQGWEIDDRYLNYYNLNAERSISGHDIPHSVAAAWIYELPVGKGRKLGSDLHPIADAVLGGWQVSGIYKWDSGLPLRFSAPDNHFSFGGMQRPDVIDIKRAAIDAKTVDRWFDKTMFAQPAPFTFGNAPRWLSNIRYDNGNNWDFALAKNFVAFEKVRIQFRTELFNAFNRVQFGRPNTTYGNPAFGTITGTAPGNGPRNVQFGLRVAF